MPQRKYCGHFGGVTQKNDPCMRPAAWGRDSDDGRCMYHYGDQSSIEEVASDGRIPEDQEIPEDMSQPPDYLDERQQKVWDTVVNFLQQSDRWQDAFWIKLRDLVHTQSVVWAVHEKLDKEGYTTYDANNDRQRKHPGFQIMRDMMSKANSLASDFGITPKDAEKMDLLTEEKQMSKSERLMRKS